MAGEAVGGEEGVVELGGGLHGAQGARVEIGDGESAGKGEVLEADGYEAFTEAGDPFDPDTAQRLLRTIYSAGNSQEPAAAYRAFRGRDPLVTPMLRKRGLLPH